MKAGPAVMFAAVWLGWSGLAAAQSASQGIVLNGAPAPVGKTCVQVAIAGQSANALNCLNQELQDQALEAAGQSAPVAPLGAGSASNAVGTFDQFGVAEQYGKNFGHSAVPFRPAPPVYGGGVH
jgi:hypothetical protein